jgi:pseudouridylate synthase
VPTLARVHPHVGMLVVNAIPEAHAMDKATIDAAIDRALREARDQGVRGKGLTPFLLKRLDELTEGKSVEANLALAEANAELGAELAVALHAIWQDAE